MNDLRHANVEITHPAIEKRQLLAVPRVLATSVHRKKLSAAMALRRILNCFQSVLRKGISHYLRGYLLIRSRQAAISMGIGTRQAGAKLTLLSRPGAARRAANR